MLNECDSIQEYLAHGSELKKLFNARFAPEKLAHPTEIALSVLFDIAPEELHQLMAEKLASQVRQAQGKVIYGMHGAWATAMVLGKFGFTDELMSIYLADEFPSFGYWRKKLGATTFWESFSEDFDMLSRNHGAFAGGLRAFYEYIAGFRHDEKAPGRNFLQLQPRFPAALNSLDVSYCNYRIRFRRENDGIELEVSVPENASALLILPDGSEKNLTAGFYQCKLPNKQ
jgi:hypothetical protein